MMMEILPVLVLLFVSTSHAAGAATTCETVAGLSGCACQFSNGLKPISLQDLVGNNTDGKPIRFRTKESNAWGYAYHPCGTFDMFMGKVMQTGDYGCHQSTAGRYTDRSAFQCQGLGDLTGSKFEVHETYDYPIVSNVTVVYVNSTQSRGARISLVCDRTLTKEQTEFKYLNVTEGPIEYYAFSLTGPCSCPGGCNLKVPSPSAAVGFLPSFSFLTMVMLVVLATMKIL